MSWKMTRRAAFAVAAGSAAASALGAENAGPGDFEIGAATYSLREFSRALAIKMLRQLGVSRISVKDMHLPYSATPDEIKKARSEFEKAGLTIVSAGNTDLKDEDPAMLRKYFEYARACGIPMLVAAPTHATLPAVEKLAKEYTIDIAIPTTGP